MEQNRTRWVFSSTLIKMDEESLLRPVVQSSNQSVCVYGSSHVVFLEHEAELSVGLVPRYKSPASTLQDVGVPWVT